MKSLVEIYNQRNTGIVSDKWSSYLNHYHRVFQSHLNKPISILEVGVQNGGSLEIWSDYFNSDSLIIGCDINDKCRDIVFTCDRIKLVIGDINNAGTINEILNHSTAFDIIIDDGSHKSEDIISTFNTLFQYLKDGGIYLCEDLHASYWYKFSGGLLHPKSSITFFKALVDIINFEHWGIKAEPIDYLSRLGFNTSCNFNAWLRHIHSVEFINSACIIKKENPVKNELGTRFISGDIEFFSSNKKYHGTRNAPPVQTENPFSNLEKSFIYPRVDNINKELQIITELTCSKVAFYNQLISKQHNQLQQMQSELIRAEAQLSLLKEFLITNDEMDKI